MAHIDTHEEDGFRRLHHLEGRRIGEQHRLITTADLDSIREPLAALLIELPQRDLGGPLPEWPELVAQTSWARHNDVALHLDGARLWQCPPRYERPLDEIAELFDTVYVSFYKDLGALAGCALAGPEDTISEARVWRRRHGGTLFSLWPNAASALSAIRTRLPRMDLYHRHALAIAAALSAIDGVRIVPDPPQTTMMHLFLRTTPDALSERARALASEEGVWTWRTAQTTDHPDWCRVELAVADSALQLEPHEIRAIVGALLP
jgi:threonine aldolase